MNQLRDVQTFTLTVLLSLILMLFTIASLGHCLGPSPQTNHQIISMYIKHYNYRLSAATRDQIATEIIACSELSGIPYEIITAIMKVESCYTPDAIGPLGEIGLMQIYTMHCGDIEFDRESLYQIDYNIAAGVCILTEKLKLAKGNLIRAIGLYNGTGLAAEVFKNKVIHVILDIFRFRIAHSNELIRRRRLLSARDY